MTEANRPPGDQFPIVRAAIANALSDTRPGVGGPLLPRSLADGQDRFRRRAGGTRLFEGPPSNEFVNTLLEEDVQVKIGFAIDGTLSMSRVIPHMRKEVASFIANQATQTVHNALEAVKDELKKHNVDLKSPLAICLTVMEAMFGDSRGMSIEHPNAIIDDPPIDVKQRYRSIIDTGLEDVARETGYLFEGLKEYTTSKSGGGNRGESVWEAIAVTLGISAKGPLEKMLAYYKEHMDQSNELNAIIQALLGIANEPPLPGSTKYDTSPPAVIMAATDEMPPDAQVTQEENEAYKKLFFAPYADKSGPTCVIGADIVPILNELHIPLILATKREYVAIWKRHLDSLGLRGYVLVDIENPAIQNQEQVKTVIQYGAEYSLVRHIQHVQQKAGLVKK